MELMAVLTAMTLPVVEPEIPDARDPATAAAFTELLAALVAVPALGTTRPALAAETTPATPAATAVAMPATETAVVTAPGSILGAAPALSAHPSTAAGTSAADEVPDRRTSHSPLRVGAEPLDAATSESVPTVPHQREPALPLTEPNAHLPSAALPGAALPGAPLPDAEVLPADAPAAGAPPSTMPSGSSSAASAVPARPAADPPTTVRSELFAPTGNGPSAALQTAPPVPHARSSATTTPGDPAPLGPDTGIGVGSVAAVRTGPADEDATGPDGRAAMRGGPPPAAPAVDRPHDAFAVPVAAAAEAIAPAGVQTLERVLAAQLVERVGALRHRPDGDYELSLELEPADLGRVELRVRLEGGVVHVHVGADSSATNDLLRRSLPELRHALAESGLSAGSLDVGTRGDAPGGGPEADHQSGSRTTAPEPTPLPRLTSRLAPIHPGADGGVDVLL